MFRFFEEYSKHSALNLGQALQGLRYLFQCGYSPWRFTESGGYRDPLPADVDRRWDPRCVRSDNLK